MTPALPRIAAHFALEGEAGRGGFGVVYRARHRGTGELAAAKVSHATAPPDELARISREVELVARLEHPHLARLLGLFVSDEGHPVLVYEWLAGGSLASRAGASVPEVLTWVEEAGAALDALHRQGLVHRDVKPENLMLDGAGHVRVVDFGLLRPEDGGRTVTATGVILGTPAFMPPELFRGERATAASDRFALAASAYWLLTGRPPFGAGSPGEIVQAQRQPPPPAPELDPALAAALATGLAADPGHRHASCGALAQALRRAAAAPAAKATAADAQRTHQVAPAPLRAPVTPRRVGAPPLRARRDLRPAVAVLALALGVGAWLAHRPSGPRALPSPAAAKPTPAPPGESVLIAIRDRLNDLDAVFTDLDGERVSDDARRADPVGTRRMLDGDPAYWPEVLAEIPALEALLAEFAAGVPLEDLPPTFLTEAARTDEAFQRNGLPRPFAPFRDLTPHAAGPDDLPTRVFLPGGELRPDFRVPLRGWAGRAQRELARMSRSFESRGADLLGGRVQTPELATTLAGLRVHTPPTVAELTNKAFGAAGLRRELAVYFREEIEGMHRALLAAGRSLRTEPETRTQVALLFGHVYAGILEGTFRSYLNRLPLALITGPLPEEDPDAAYLLYRLPSTREVGQGAFSIRSDDAAEVPDRLEALARSASGPGEGALARLRRTEARDALVMGLATRGKPREALAFFLAARRELNEAGEPVPESLVHSASRALEAAGGGLPPDRARELRAYALALPNLERFLTAPDPLAPETRWSGIRFQARDHAELKAHLDAAVAACEAEAEAEAAGVPAGAPAAGPR